MTRKELLGAFVSVTLALRDKIQYQNSKATLKTLAYSYGAKISKPKHIDKVFECVDLGKLESLVHDSETKSGVLKRKTKNAESGSKG